MARTAADRGAAVYVLVWLGVLVLAYVYTHYRVQRPAPAPVRVLPVAPEALSLDPFYVPPPADTAQVLR